MRGHLEGLDYGINMIAEIGGKNREVLMDVIVRRFQKKNREVFYEVNKEMAILLLNGEIEISWNEKKKVISRSSVFNESPWCLHVPRNVEVKIQVLEESEILIQCTENFRSFEAVLYSPDKCKIEVSEDVNLNLKGRREVRTIFNYENAPYSNMVMGEVITYPGKWSNYISSKQPQPEVFCYKYDRPQEIGRSSIWDYSYKIKDNSVSMAEGGSDYPQASALDNKMYFCWMIRHLHGNPWKATTV